MKYLLSILALVFSLNTFAQNPKSQHVGDFTTVKVFDLIKVSLVKSDENKIKSYANDKGILSIMYHRFNENKYPSTNIRMEVFKKHMEIIKRKKYDFLDPNDFDKNFFEVKTTKKILITIDDGFRSFYEHAWPYLKDNKIPFILFVSTEAVGKMGI